MRFHRLFGLFGLLGLLVEVFVPFINVVQNGFGQSEVCSSLMRPNTFFPILADAIQDEMAFFSHDMAGNAVFVSKSAEQVFNRSLSDWQRLPFWEVLSEASINAPIRSWKETVESTATGRICEVLDRDGNRLKLKCWLVHILNEGVPVGVTGIARRMHATDDSIEDNTELWNRFQSLTAVEAEVVEMVMNGKLNKEMATELNVAVRTIESRRARAMTKLQVKSISELVQAWVKIRHLACDKGTPASYATF